MGWEEKDRLLWGGGPHPDMLGRVVGLWALRDLAGWGLLSRHHAAGPPSWPGPGLVLACSAVGCFVPSQQSCSLDLPR